jgi:hypothetical protein
MTSVLKNKDFITLTLNIKGIKPFSSSLSASAIKLDCLPITRFKNLSSLFVPDVSDEEKSFLRFGTWCQRYKTFFFDTVASDK